MSKRDETDAVDEALRCWRQGDVSLDAGLEFVHLADLSRPHSPASIGLTAPTKTSGITPILEEVEGVVVLTQTCDIVRPCTDRPFVEVAPLVKVDDMIVEQIRRLKRPAFAYVPATAEDSLVADLDRVMTVEKAVLASWTRTLGWNTDNESREFAYAIARKRRRFAFPDDFVRAADRFRRRLFDKHTRKSSEGNHLRALREIRVRAKPSWISPDVELTVWFVRDQEPDGSEVDWPGHIDSWCELFDESGRFRITSPVVCRLEDITARDYTESEVLDLDSLSVT